MNMFFSFIIPVYNRPEEVAELLESLSIQDYSENFEVVIIEDGSSVRCEAAVDKYRHQLSISYFYKENSGPGDSRNFGMRKAKGNYFIILDSDCIVPNQYLLEVDHALKDHFVDCFGGPDRALDSFSEVQKAINFTMTSFLTTGGIRGGSEKVAKFEPRSFNMGLSLKAFMASGGFSNIHPGEDPDLSFRLWNLGFETQLLTRAFVYHKRRIDWKKFSIQVNKFGKARPILNFWHPERSKLVYFFPSIFILGFFFSMICVLFSIHVFLFLYMVYFLLLFVTASFENKSITIGLFAIVAAWKQFFGYGTGFLLSFFKINILKQQPQEAFPELFFEK